VCIIGSKLMIDKKEEIYKMDNLLLSRLLFPDIDKTPDYYEERYPKRELKDGAKVTRLGPSPTGFIHLGNLYGAFADERLAHQSGGTFYLRIEDTDEKREVPGAVEAIISSLNYFGVNFDEGVTVDGETGKYGPYYQRKREAIYQCYGKHLVEKGLAYPCFCSEEDIQNIREHQEKKGANPGYYGEYAKCRNLSSEEIQTKISQGKPFVLRLRSFGDPAVNFSINDGIRGHLSMPENFQDIVLLKQNGIPTYHFAHVIDDHLMRTTHVVRGEEWLSSLPIHVALFETLDWPLPTYCHTTVLMKMEGEIKRKLSKRKDPELSLDYYRGLGYHPDAVREYLLTILNSNFEEWRLADPNSSIEEFEFSAEKMSNSGTLFDLDKLNDVSKDVLSRISDEDLYSFLMTWAKEYRPELASLFAKEEEMMMKILAMDRHGDKPRKDLIFCEQIFDFISYFFEEYFDGREAYPIEVDESDTKIILQNYIANYSHNDDKQEWFDKIRTMATELGYAAKPKDFKKNPEVYKGHVGHVSTVIRIALMGRSSSPDIWEIQQILGSENVLGRMREALNKI
jgi:glutamyl-tRNA synthetase